MNKTNILNFKLVAASALSMTAFVMVGLVAGNQQASAVVDTCTWVGAGTGTPDAAAMPNKTLTFDVSEAANWNCSIDGTAAPEAGDTLEFPANLATVDSANSLSDDIEWRYVINNDLAINTQLAGIMFTGDVGIYDCAANNDGYVLSGNAIQLNGNVASTFNQQCVLPVLKFHIGITADVTIAASVDFESTVTYGANVVTFNSTASQPSINGTLSGTGLLQIGRASINPRTGSTIGTNVTVLEDSNIVISLPSVLNDEALTLTLLDGATFGLYSGNAVDNEFMTNIVFVGGGGTSGYWMSNDTTVSSNYVNVANDRGTVGGSEYNFETDKSTKFDIELSGDMTLSSDMVLKLDSSVELTGALTGSYEISIIPGSVGSLTVNSPVNNSGTPNSTILPTRINKSLVAAAFDVFLNSGEDGMLDPDEEITAQMFVGDGARLLGSGKVAGLEVRAGGTVAPGESPGCIESDGDLTLNGTYEFEILSNVACTGYDQLDVTGAVDVTGGTLDVTLLDGYGFDEGDGFVLINNDGTDGVIGTFPDFAEGDEIIREGNTFVLSYEGGDGNDVTLTATGVSEDNPGSEIFQSQAGGSVEDEDAPGAPDTGVGSLIQNPIVTMFAAALAAGTIVGIRRINS